MLADETAEAPAPQPKAIAAASGGVTIADFSFSPATLTINQGDTVTWVNNGPTAHSATANNGSFNTGILKAGQSASHTFAQAGTYSYFCQPHPFMKATIVVQAAQAGGTSGGSTDSGADREHGLERHRGDSVPGGRVAPRSRTRAATRARSSSWAACCSLLGFAVHRRARLSSLPRP